MTIYQLECFIAVAEELNFSAAAQRLFTTQPAITYQINTLEKETGLHLFDRTTRRTKLTAAGQSFYLDMVQMTSFGRQALKKAQDIQAADRSHLVVGLRQLFDYGTFASILAEYQRQYPNAQVEVIPQSNRRPLEELRSGQLDIGFFYATEHSSDRDVSFTPLFSLTYYVLMNPNCPLADRKALHLADLKGQSVVSSGAFDSFLSACQGPSLEELAQVGVDCSKITPSFEGALIMITMGTAMSIVPCLDDAVIPGITKVPLLDYPPGDGGDRCHAPHAPAGGAVFYRDRQAEIQPLLPGAIPDGRHHAVKKGAAVQLHGGSFGRGGFTGSGPGSRRGLRSAFRSGGHPRHRWRPAWCRPYSFCSCSPCFRCSGRPRWSGR